ncbi:MAG: hypothetical protein J0L60_06740 [Ignavibacteria bacterium]|nr:hypothetical protein [Ignavibacteria bacterium]
MSNAVTQPVQHGRSNLSLVRVSQELIGDANKLNTIYQELKDRTICLIPETANFSADRSKKLSLTVITVDTKMESAFGNQDIYKTDSGTFALHLTKLKEIFLSAGGNVIDSRILERKVDQDGRVLFISHQLKGKIQSIDGTIKEAVATGKYDFIRDCDRFQKNGQPNMAAVNQRRKHAEALAESNAMQRLIMSLVAKLKASYTIHELQSKPIIVACVTEDKAGLLEMLPEAERALVRSEYVRAKLGLGNPIYEGKQIEQAIPEAKEVKVVDVSLSDEEYEEIEAETSHTEDVSETLFSADPRDVAEMYRDLTPDDRTERIMGLVESTGYVSPKGVPITPDAIEALSLNQQISFVERLLKLKAEQEAVL